MPKRSTSRRFSASTWREPTSRKPWARSSEMRTFHRLAIVVALGGTLGTVLSCGHGPAREKPARPVRVENVRAEGPGGGLRYSATVQPSEQVSLAFKVGGYVREVLQRPGVDGRPRDLQQGDPVTKGTVLARITET